MAKKDASYIVSENMELFSYYDRQRKEYEKKWNQVYKLYKAYVDKKNYPWKSNLFIPLCFQLVENILPRYINGNVHFDYQPKTQEDVDKAKAMNLLVNDYQIPRMRFDYKRILWLKQEILYGTSWAFPRWVSKRRLPPPESSERMFKEKRSIYQPYYEGPDIEVADSFHVWGDAQADDETRSTAIIYEDIMDIGYFMAEYEEDLKKQKIDREALEKSFESVKYKYNLVKTDLKSTNQGGLSKSKHVLVMRIFYDNRWVTIANRNLLVSDTENPTYYPGKPVARLCSIPMKGELYGSTLLDMISSLQFELNDIRNQRIDNVKLTIDRMAIAARNSTLNQSQLGTAPGKIIWVEDIEEVDKAIRFIDIPDVSQSGLFEEDKIYRDFERTTGMTDFQTGLSGVEGATVSSLLESKLNNKIVAKAKTLAASGLHTLGMIIASLNEQYLDKEIAIRVLGDNNQWTFPDTHKVKPNQLTSELDLNVEFRPTNEFRKPQILQSMMQLLPYAKTDPHINMRAYWMEIFGLLDQRNISELMSTGEQKKAPDILPIEAAQARKENTLLGIGQTPRADQNDLHNVHLMIHKLGMEEADTPDQKDRYRQHIGMHEQFMSGQGPTQPDMQEQPNQEINPDVMQTMQAANMQAQMGGMSPAQDMEPKRPYTRGDSTNVGPAV